MLRNPCDVMTAGIREMLACGFGKETVVDVLEGTKLEHYSKKLGFGLFVVKGAVEPSLQEVWANGCDRMFQAIAKQHGANSVEVRRRLPIYSDENTPTSGSCRRSSESAATGAGAGNCRGWAETSTLFLTYTRVATMDLAEF